MDRILEGGFVMGTKNWKEIRANKLSPIARARVEAEVR
jgi:hypothetical protein